MTKEEPNILLIVVDCLRADHLGCYGYQKPVSPAIDKIAKEGVLFTNAYSCSNNTDPSLISIVSGRYPISHGVIRTGPRVQIEEIEQLMENETHFLSEILKSKGYTTLAVDWLGRFHKREYDLYVSRMPKKAGVALEEANKYVDIPLQYISRRFARLRKSSIIDEGDIVSDYAINLIRKNHARKFFLLVHYWDAHYPYAPPIDYYKVVDNQGIKRLAKEIGKMPWKKLIYYYLHHGFGIAHKINSNPNRLSLLDREDRMRYDAAIAFIDHEIQRIIEILEEYGILEKTLVVLTGDHGESLGEHGIWGHGHGLYDVDIHVPLIFRYSEFPKNKIIKGLVQHVDIAPTIIDLLGIETKAFNFDGKSTIPLIFGNEKYLHSTVYAEEAYWERKRAIRTSQYKYIYALSEKEAVCTLCKRIHGGVEELYDLLKDPNETLNIIKGKPRIVSMLKRQIYDWISEHATEKRRVKEKIKKLKDFGKI